MSSLRRIKCGRTREIVARARAQGFDVRPGRNNHLAVYTPDGTWVAAVSSTTGDSKSHLPLRAALRRAGYVGV